MIYLSEMNKDFKKWHNRKEYIHKNSSQVFFHEREIWWCSLGLNIGFEQDGNGPEFQRPVIILRKFNNDVCWVLPITTKPKTGKYYFPVDLGDKTERRVILSQLRLIVRGRSRLYSKNSKPHIKSQCLAPPAKLHFCIL